MNRQPFSVLPQQSPRAATLWALVGVLIALAQLNESLAAATVLQQVYFWGGRLVALVVSLFAAQWAVNRWLYGRLAAPTWLKSVLIVTALALLPFAAAELWLERRLPIVIDQDDQLLWMKSPLLAFAAEYATLATIVLPLHFLVWWLIERRGHVSGDRDRPPPEFLSKTHGVRLENVTALKAEEHYLRVFSTDGSELVHYKFGDALVQMPNDIGLQVHRSWWVADAHVCGAERGARRWRLLLPEGVSAPVSDRFVQDVRSRGHLKRRRRGSPG